MRATWRRGVWWIGLVAVLGSAVGCRGSQASTAEAETGGDEETPAGPPADWPRVLVIGPGTGPALFLGAEQDAPAFGYLNPGVRIRLESAPQNDRIEVLVAGPLATKGWIPVERVAAYTQVRGRVEGTRTYVGPNDLVGVLGPADTEGQMRVEVRPWLGGSNFLGPFVGTYPTAQLSADRAEGELEGPTPGECYRLPAAQEVPVYDRQGGEVVARLPATDPPLTVTVLRNRDGWFGVRAGFGPYLTGYVQGALVPCGGPAPAPAPMVPPSSSERPYWMDMEQGALHRVADGTRVNFHGRTIARMRGQGWAREIGRQDGELVDAFLAIDDGVAIRGLVPSSALTLVEGQPSTPAPRPAPAPAAPAAPEEDLPDELAD